MSNQSDLLSDLLSIGVFKLGSFQLKTGPISPFYVDLRKVISYPKILNSMISAIHRKKESQTIQADIVCGVPYTSLPIASVLCSRHGIPLIMRRKEVKGYGTNRRIEGVFTDGQICLIVEDTVVSGTSILETANDLRNAGLVVTDCICILDRTQGGKANLLREGINLHCLYDFNDIFGLYCSMNDVSEDLRITVREYLKENVYSLEENVIGHLPSKENNELPIVQRLRKIVSEKKTNLCLAADVTKSADLLRLAEDLGPHICMLKTHIDIIEDFDKGLPSQLKALSEDLDFLILEDRKFADAGEVVRCQYEGGLYRIKDWADIVTVQSSSAIDGLKSATNGKDQGCLLIGEMSCLDVNSSQEHIVEMAEGESDFVMGFICQKKIVDSSNFVHIFQGDCVTNTINDSPVMYNTPEAAVENGADVIIVGSDIYDAIDRVQTALDYKTRAYDAYVKRCQGKESL